MIADPRKMNERKIRKKITGTKEKKKVKVGTKSKERKGERKNKR